MSKNSEMQEHTRNLFSFQHPLKPRPKPQPSRNFTMLHPKPNIVRFPKPEVVVPPLQVQAGPNDHHYFSTTTSNPILISQAYILGGLILLKWIWARWYERNNGGILSTERDEMSSRNVIGKEDISKEEMWKECVLLKIESVGLEIKTLKQGAIILFVVLALALVFTVLW